MGESIFSIIRKFLESQLPFADIIFNEDDAKTVLNEHDEILNLRAELARKDEIIARLKETLPTLKISHNYCEDCWYSCPKAEGGCCNDAEGEHCNCGADKHNAIIDALMKELE